MGRRFSRPHARVRRHGTVLRSKTVTIFAHPDKVGQDKARELASKLHKRGLEVFIEGIAP